MRRALAMCLVVMFALVPLPTQAQSLDDQLKALEKQIEQVERQVEEAERQVEEAEGQVNAAALLVDGIPHGMVVSLQGTPHLWIADEHGVLHWGGDTRALAGKHIAWSNRVKVNLVGLLTLPIGDPWLSAGLLKSGDPIYLVKWESEWAVPKLLHIQSIADVELFGINGSNYGNFVLDQGTWEARYGIPADGLERGTLDRAVQ